MSSSEVVPIKKLASTMGMDRSNVRKYALKNGFQFVKKRVPGTRGMYTLTLTQEEADRLAKMRETQGFSGCEKHQAVGEDVGVFYVIQLVPDLDPRRVKFGFAGSIEQRLAQHRTAAPTCSVLAFWPCRKNWEQTVIAAITAENSRLIRNEAYECDDLDALVDRGGMIFSLLPSPSLAIPLVDSFAVEPPELGQNDTA